MLRAGRLASVISRDSIYPDLCSGLSPRTRSP